MGALEDYLDIAVVSHKRTTPFSAASQFVSRNWFNFKVGLGFNGIAGALARTERAARNTDSHKILLALESFALSVRSGRGRPRSQ